MTQFRFKLGPICVKKESMQYIMTTIERQFPVYIAQILQQRGHLVTYPVVITLFGDIGTDWGRPIVHIPIKMSTLSDQELIAATSTVASAAAAA